jgi:hypothetical protein
MGQAGLTALMIVRNEVRNLPDCIGSIAGSVDEIVVVDTGSDDGTVDLARKAGARVSHFHWIGDFAAARNAAIEACRTEWGFYIDADERLAPASRGAIRDSLDEYWFAADVLLRPRHNYTRCRLPRLFRIDPRIRFEGAIHETIIPSLERLPQHETATGLTGIEIDHLGYEGDLTAKHHRNLPLLIRCVADWPDRVYYRLHLAETLLGLDRPDEALAAGRAGIALAERLDAPRSRIDGAVICQLLAAHQLQKGDDPLGLIEAGLVLHPGNHGLLLTLAQRNLKYGEAESALGIARRLQGIDPDALTPGPLAYDRDIFGRHAINIEIASLFRLGRKAEAASVLASKSGTLAP